MQQPRLPGARWVLASLIIMATVLLGLSWLVVPSLIRWQTRSRMLADLTSADLIERERALNHLIRYAADDEVLLSGSLARLAEADALNVLQILNALHHANMVCDYRVIAAAAASMARAKDSYLQQYYLVFADARCGDAPPLLRALLDQINEADTDRMLDLTAMLQLAGQWQHPSVPAKAYLRWLQVLGTSQDTDTRVMAAQRAADVPSLAHEPRLLDLVDRWLNDNDTEVRRTALISLCEIIRGVANRDRHLDLIAQMVHDADAAVARRAWILLRQYKAAQRATWTQLDQRITVTEAMLWALNMRGNRLRESLDGLTNPCDRSRALGMQAYVAAMDPMPGDRQTIESRLEQHWKNLHQHSIDEATQIMLWRLLLALRTINEEMPHAASQRILAQYQALDINRPKLGILSVIAAHGAAIHVVSEEDQSMINPLRLLAAIEGLSGKQHTLHIGDSALDIIRLMGASVSREPNLRALRSGLASPEATIRDLACTIAAERLSPQQHEQLVGALLNDFNDNAKRSGAVLAGLTGARRDLLRKKMNAEDIWSVQQIHRLGMWMQHQEVRDPEGRLMEMDRRAVALLMRDDLPTSTILLAMLSHSRDGCGSPSSRVAWEAIDVLFNPRRTNQLDLEDLLVTRRWWYVLRHYLPAGAPPFWVWADPHLQSFQVEVLRNWFLVHGQQPSMTKP